MLGRLCSQDRISAVPGGEQFLAPLREAMAHVCDHVWCCAIFSERGVSDLGKCPEGVCKQQPIETVVSIGGKFEQLLARVPAGGEGSIHVKEVTGEGSAKEASP